MNPHRKYKGVTQNASKSNPWKAQINLGAKLEYLGSFPASEEAARAYDNAAFYAGRTGRCKRLKLNFPEDYASEPYPEPTEQTLEIIGDVEARMPLKPGCGAQIGYFPDREFVRGKVQQLKAARGAERASKAVGDAILSELHERLSVDSRTVQQEVEFMRRLEKSPQLEPWQEAELLRLKRIYSPDPDSFSGQAPSSDSSEDKQSTNPAETQVVTA